MRPRPNAAYRVPRDRILTVLTELAGDPRFRFEDPDRVRSALGLYQRGAADLADYLVGLASENTGARTTFTFERALRGESRFTMVPRRPPPAPAFRPLARCGS